MIILDDPFEFKPVVRKVFPSFIIRYTYVDDLAGQFQKAPSDKTEEGSRKKKVYFRPLGRSFGFTLFFRPNPSSPRYASLFLYKLHLTFIFQAAPPAVPVPEEPATRKRRRTRNSHVFDAEQDFIVPGTGV